MTAIILSSSGCSTDVVFFGRNTTRTALNSGDSQSSRGMRHYPVAVKLSGQQSEPCRRRTAEAREEDSVRAPSQPLPPPLLKHIGRRALPITKGGGVLSHRFYNDGGRLLYFCQTSSIAAA